MTLKKTARTIKILEGLDETTQPVISALLDCAYELGMNAQLHSGYRSPTEQDTLYALGRTKPGKIVTNAKGTPVPQSSHCYKKAVDLHFVGEDGTAQWDFKLYKKLWDAAKPTLEKKGLVWGGNWTSFSEGPHFEVTSGKGWRELAKEAGYKVEEAKPAVVAAATPAKKKK